MKTKRKPFHKHLKKHLKKIKSIYRSFTLLELLIVIAIGTLLSLTIIFAVGNAFKKSRDARRKIDLGQIKGALESYYNDHLRYPPTFPSSGPLCHEDGCDVKKYLALTPIDPLTKEPYLYQTNEIGNYYKIYTEMESITEPGGYPDAECNDSLCNYIITSPNITPGPTVSIALTPTTPPAIPTEPSEPTPTPTPNCGWCMNQCRDLNHVCDFPHGICREFGGPCDVETCCDDGPHYCERCEYVPGEGCVDSYIPSCDYGEPPCHGIDC